MLMKKPIFAGLLVLVAMVLSGCGSDNNQTKVPASTPSVNTESLRSTGSVSSNNVSDNTFEIGKQDAEVKTRAEQILQRATNGENFESLARAYDEDPGSRVNGGDLGFAKKGQYIPAVENVIFDPNFKSGEVWPDLVKSSYGWHVFKKVDERGWGVDREVRVEQILLVDQSTQTYFYDGHDFSDGVAWVKDTDSSNWKAIDEKGRTLFNLGSNSTPITDFIYGGALVEVANSKNKINIIDKNGTVVFPTDDSTEYAFVVSSRNYHFVKKHINTFEKTEDQIGIVDNTGKWVMEPTSELRECASSLWCAFTKDGIIGGISYRGNNFYDSYTNEFFNNKSDFYDESVTARILKQSYGDGMMSVHDGLACSGDTSSDCYAVSAIGLKNPKNGFYDKSNDLVIDLSSLNKPLSIGNFSDGYCSIQLNNPQGNHFYVVIDKTGNRMFEPVEQSIGKVSCGRVLVGRGYYIDVSGKTVIPNIANGSDFVEGSCLAKLGKPVYGTGGNVHYIDTNGNIAF